MGRSARVRGDARAAELRYAEVHVLDLVEDVGREVARRLLGRVDRERSAPRAAVKEARR